MTALPCSHPHCCSIGYALRTDAGEWRSLVGMIGHEELKANLDLVSNRIADRELPARLRRLLKDSLLGPAQRPGLAHPPERAPAPAQRLRPLRPRRRHPGPLATRPGAEGRRRIRELLAHRVKRIVVKPFMDIHTMLEERLQQCCVHVGSGAKTAATSARPSAPCRRGRSWAAPACRPRAAATDEQAVEIGRHPAAAPAAR